MLELDSVPPLESFVHFYDSPEDGMKTTKFNASPRDDIVDGEFPDSRVYTDSVHYCLEDNMPWVLNGSHACSNLSCNALGTIQAGLQLLNHTRLIGRICITIETSMRVDVVLEGVVPSDKVILSPDTTSVCRSFKLLTANIVLNTLIILIPISLYIENYRVLTIHPHSPPSPDAASTASNSVASAAHNLLSSAVTPLDHR